jgi:hypothetical protein
MRHLVAAQRLRKVGPCDGEAGRRSANLGVQPK